LDGEVEVSLGIIPVRKRFWGWDNAACDWCLDGGLCAYVLHALSLSVCTYGRIVPELLYLYSCPQSLYVVHTP
jgi:hypothetical protein